MKHRPAPGRTTPSLPRFLLTPELKHLGKEVRISVLHVLELYVEPLLFGSFCC